MKKRKGKRYRKYLLSPQWRGLRQRTLERDGHTCQRCGENGRPGNELDVHHLDYTRLYNEDLNDLVTLCRNCHGDTHAAIDGTINNRMASLRRYWKEVEDAILDKIFGN